MSSTPSKSSAAAATTATFTPRRSLRRLPSTPDPKSHLPPPPITPSQSEPPKSKRGRKPNRRVSKSLGPTKPQRRTYYRKVVYDGGEFEVGDDVYIKRKEGEESNAEPDVEECRVCFEVGKSVMIECDECLGGFHLKCLKPPLRKIPEGDWICGWCEGKRKGVVVEMPKPPEGKKLRRTMKERLLSSDLWAARIER